MVDTHTELVGGLVLRFHRRQVLEPALAVRERDVGEKRLRDRVEPVGGDLVVGERRASAGRGVDGARVADRSESGEIAGAQRGVRHRKGLGDRPACALPLVADEEEGAILHKAAAERPAELMLLERRHRRPPVVEEVVRVEPVVPDELEQAAVDAVAACLGRHVDQRRRLPPELGRVHRLLDLDLLNRVD